MTASDIKKWQTLVESVFLAENDQQIEQITKYPFNITTLKSVDPATWTNAQAKKSIIKYILECLQSDEVDYQLQAAHMFDALKNLNCPWHELSVLETHVDNLINNTSPEDLGNYIDFAQTPIPLFEPYIIKSPILSYYYARNALKSRWPEAEPIIMTAPQWAYYYVRDVMNQRWPEAEPTIMKNHMYGKFYKRLVKSFTKNTKNTKNTKRPLEEDYRQITRIINDPFEIVYMSIDPSIWKNNQVKKAVIKLIINELDSAIPHYQLSAVHVFNTLVSNKCPWPEISVLAPHIDEILTKTDPQHLYNYIINHAWPTKTSKILQKSFEPYIIKDPYWAFRYSLNVLKGPWPEAEPTIMTEPVESYWYARDVLKRPWPEAEPTIMTEPDAAAGYAMRVLGRPWPEAEAEIMTDPQVAKSYTEFVKSYKQPLKENQRNFYNIKSQPIHITKIKKIDPEIWADAQVKKAVIKYILTGIQSSLAVIQNYAVDVYLALERHKCPWPEMAIIKKYLIEHNLFDPERLFLYAFNNLHTRWPDAEPYIAKDARAAYEYNMAFINNRWPESEPAILSDPELAFFYAENIIKGPWPEAESIILTDPKWAYFYAMDILRKPWPKAEPVIITDPLFAAAYAIYGLKKPWPEAEPIIYSDAEATDDYERFLLTRDF